MTVAGAVGSNTGADSIAPGVIARPVVSCVPAKKFLPLAYVSATVSLSEIREPPPDTLPGFCFNTSRPRSYGVLAVEEEPPLELPLDDELLRALLLARRALDAALPVVLAIFVVNYTID